MLVHIWRPPHPSQSNNDTIAFQQGQCPVLGSNMTLGLLLLHHTSSSLDNYFLNPSLDDRKRLESWEVVSVNIGHCVWDQQVVTICTTLSWPIQRLWNRSIPWFCSASAPFGPQFSMWLSFKLFTSLVITTNRGDAGPHRLNSAITMSQCPSLVAPETEVW